MPRAHRADPTLHPCERARMISEHAPDRPSLPADPVGDELRAIADEAVRKREATSHREALRSDRVAPVEEGEAPWAWTVIRGS